MNESDKKPEAVHVELHIAEKSSKTVIMIFNLQDSVKVGGKITNSDDIEFVIDPERPDCITQFRIKLINPSWEDENKALEKASEITNYLTMMVNRVVEHKLPIIQRIVNGKMTNAISYTVDTVLHKDFDLDACFLNAKLLNKNADLNKRLDSYNSGLKKLQNNDFAGAIQSFYQCIEKTGIPEEEQYKPLRHATSHQRIDNSDVIKELNKIGIKIDKGESLNENDTNNQYILKMQTIGLRLKAFNYLNTKLTNL